MVVQLVANTPTSINPVSLKKRLITVLRLCGAGFYSRKFAPAGDKTSLNVKMGGNGHHLHPGRQGSFNAGTAILEDHTLSGSNTQA